MALPMRVFIPEARARPATAKTTLRTTTDRSAIPIFTGVTARGSSDTIFAMPKFAHYRVHNSLLTLGLCCLAALLSACGDKISDADIEFVSLSDVRAVVQEKSANARLIDPRSADEYAQGHIPGAIHLPLVRVSDEKDKLDPALARFKRLIVYGNDPGSAVARAVTKRLMRSGANDVKLYSGGLSDWIRAGLKVDRDPTAPAPASATQPAAEPSPNLEAVPPPPAPPPLQPSVQPPAAPAPPK